MSTNKRFEDLEQKLRTASITSHTLIEEAVSFLGYSPMPQSLPLTFIRKITDAARAGLKRKMPYDNGVLKIARRYCNEGNRQIRLEKARCKRIGKQFPELLNYWNSQFYTTAAFINRQMAKQDHENGTTYLLSAYKNASRAMQSTQKNSPSPTNTKFLAFAYNQRAEIAMDISRRARKETPFWIEKAISDSTEGAELFEKTDSRQAIFEYANIVKEEWMLTKYFITQRDFEQKKDHAMKAVLNGEKCTELLENHEDKELSIPLRHFYFNLARSYRALYDCTTEDNYREKACKNFERFIKLMPPQDKMRYEAQDTLEYLQKIKASSKLPACPSPK